MKKATKPEIMRDLRAMRTSQLEAKKDDNEAKVNELKDSLVAKHRQAIKDMVELMKPVYAKVDSLKNTLISDPDINMRNYVNSDFITWFTSVERVEQFIKDRANWYRGSVQVLKDKLSKETKELEREWDNLLINASTMTAKDLRQFIVDNKIDLPCMREQQEAVTSVAVINVNLDLLFGANRDAK